MSVTARVGSLLLLCLTVVAGCTSASPAATKATAIPEVTASQTASPFPLAAPKSSSPPGVSNEVAAERAKALVLTAAQFPLKSASIYEERPVMLQGYPGWERVFVPTQGLDYLVKIALFPVSSADIKRIYAELQTSDDRGTAISGVGEAAYGFIAPGPTATHSKLVVRTKSALIIVTGSYRSDLAPKSMQLNLDVARAQLTLVASALE